MHNKANQGQLKSRRAIPAHTKRAMRFLIYVIPRSENGGDRKPHTQAVHDLENSPRLG